MCKIRHMKYTRRGLGRGSLTRKNVMVDARKVRQLARALDTSESEAVRHAVDAVLLEREVMEAARRIRARGGLKDVFQRFDGGGQ